MVKQIKLNLRATSVFFLVRLVAAALIGVVYFFIAANIQYWIVSILGANTFNYILGGVMSLALGCLVCSYVGRVIFWFVRGWHVGAIAYARKIIKQHLPALDVGMTAFKKHFTSFAMVYGVGMLVRKMTKMALDSLWGLLDDVPFLCELERFSDNPIIQHVAGDILDTAFDALVYYFIRYTKPGVGDDFGEIGNAIRKYLYALPQMLIASLSTFVGLYVAPKVVAGLFILTVFLKQGFVDGIMICALMPPIFYILKHSVFEPMETIVLLSGYTKYCKEVSEEEEAESPYVSAVNAILESMGIDTDGDSSSEEDSVENVEEADAGSEEGVTVKIATRGRKPMQPDGVDDEEEDEAEEAEEEEPVAVVKMKDRPAGRARVVSTKQQPAGESTGAEEVLQKPRTQASNLSQLARNFQEATAMSSTDLPEEALDIGDLPLADDEADTPVESTKASSGGLTGLLEEKVGNRFQGEVSESVPEQTEEEAIPITRMSSMLSGNVGSQLVSAFSKS